MHGEGGKKRGKIEWEKKREQSHKDGGKKKQENKTNIRREGGKKGGKNEWLKKRVTQRW